jgi:hypothetical protein
VRQRGISQVEVVVVLAVIIALAAGAWWLEAHGESVGYQRAAHEIAVRDNEQLRRVQGELDALRKDVARRERQHELNVAAIDAEGQRKLGEIIHAKDRFVSDVVAGRIRLFDPHARATVSGSGARPGAGTSPGVDHGAGGGELSAEFTGFLAAEAARADRAVTKLAACQALLLEDRKTCNATAGPERPAPP